MMPWVAGGAGKKGNELTLYKKVGRMGIMASLTKIGEVRRRRILAGISFSSFGTVFHSVIGYEKNLHSWRFHKKCRKMTSGMTSYFLHNPDKLWVNMINLEKIT
jgi:hypothetical protein